LAATVWKGFVSFGLVSFPIRLQVAAREKPSISLAPPLKREDLVKGYGISKNEYVIIEQAELAKIAPKSAQVMQVLEFIKTEDFDPVFLDKSYHAIPDGNLTKPYALFREAMRQSGQYAIAQLAMHDRSGQHFGCTTQKPGGKQNGQGPSESPPALRRLAQALRAVPRDQPGAHRVMINRAKEPARQQQKYQIETSAPN